MNKVIENIKTRRSVRSYKDIPIRKEYIDSIIEAGLYAPSARNSQNWQFTIVQKEENLSSLSDAIAEVLGREYNKFYYAPVLIITSAPKDYKYSLVDCATAIENMMLASNSLDLGSVWINQLTDICDDPRVRVLLTKLGIPQDHMLCGAVALGYPQDNFEKDRKNRGIVVFD